MNRVRDYLGRLGDQGHVSSPEQVQQRVISAYRLRLEPHLIMVDDYVSALEQITADVKVSEYRLREARHNYHAGIYALTDMLADPKASPSRELSEYLEAAGRYVGALERHVDGDQVGIETITFRQGEFRNKRDAVRRGVL